MNHQPTEKAPVSKLERTSLLAAIALLEFRLKEELLRAAACRTALSILKGA
jgi:hypothetical protein